MKKTKWIKRISEGRNRYQLISYGLLILILALGYSLLISGLSLIFGTSIRADHPFLIGVIVFALFFLFQPLYVGIQAFVNQSFDLGHIRNRERLANFNRGLTRSMKQQDIIDLLRRNIEEALSPIAIHIYLYDTLTDHYFAAPDEENNPTSDLRFPSNHPLPQFFTKNSHYLFLKDSQKLPDVLSSAQERLTLLGAVLYIPLPGQHRLTGWLALLPRQSGLPYSRRELSFLEEIADQASMAIERSQVIADLERRVHEMNVLTRFSQGINVTLTFDDTLELIYAHATLLMPVKDFFITLYDAPTSVLYHAFYLENEERITEKENQPIPYGQGLEREIIVTRRALATMDYERECRSRGTLNIIQNIYSWVGVPLNTGAETIGVISLGSRNPDIIFTDEQANLLQAIADQAAGAIVKTRLLQDAERRTNQLTTLNEVAQGISSTLALEPLLYEILRGAIDILNCEIGRLYLMDLLTQELVLQANIGEDESDLGGQRFSSDLGLIGQAASTQKALILNDIPANLDADGENEWLNKTSIRDVLVVPMLLKDSATGVVIVANRLDGMPFSLDDQGLLLAFSSQAAIALENARLYTSTDQILAERVEELSVMQRVDQELNASLDVNRAMRITLEWAMRQSQATAGLIGMVAENGVRIIASQGYSGELDIFEHETIPQTFLPFQAAFHTRQPQSIQVENQANQAILASAASLIVIPIRREDEVIGILLLENNQSGAYSEEIMAFLTRLSDHAAIAIANARLYTQVQFANQAKNEFISFVSHELKTPMTSIRGFTDLLASGIVGSINENQSNFLGTIRSNVDRMATLVSDLTDVSRIEAGRIRLDYSAVPVSEVVDEVVRSIRTQISEKEQVLEVLVPDDLPAMWGDRVRLIQILTNLLSNAHKYSSPQGHITITAELMDQTLEQGKTQAIHLSVKDNGLGISPEHQKNIFQKFYRSDDQKVRDTPGTGLGLNISKQLIELQGGQIWFESTYRVGTTFHITVPIAEIQS